MKKDAYKLLKNDLEMKWGKKITRSKDCAELAGEITNNIHRNISVSTVKRFFDIIESPFKPSKYTLDTFTKYIGFNDWEEYSNCYDQSKYNVPEHGSWEFLQKRARIITDYSLISIKLRSGYNPEKSILRKFSQIFFERFLTSQKNVSVLSAPFGFGKSTAFIQLVEQYFLNKNAPYKNDIVLLIDGKIFFNLYTKNAGVELLNQLLDFDIGSSPEFYFHNKPDERKGRFLLFIDNIDEIFFEKEKYHRLLENIMRMIMAYEDGWYKMIFTCRPENADLIQHLVFKNPILKSTWFEIDFGNEKTKEKCNIPPFSDEEMKELIQKYEPDLNFETLNSNKLLMDSLRNPQMFSLYAKLKSEKKSVSAFDWIKEYVSSRLYTPPYQEEKLKIIDSFLELCEKGKKKTSVGKYDLLAEVNYQLAYRELISYGIVQEFIVPEGFFQNKLFVKFRDELVFNYVLLEYWLRNETVNIQLFNRIINFYDNNIEQQCNLMQLFLNYLVSAEEYELLDQIRKEIRSNTNLLTENSAFAERALKIIEH